jgi:predicted DNA-binding protein YlxM (UPF0122 family)
LQQIGDTVNITRQRVYQIVKKMKTRKLGYREDD